MEIERATIKDVPDLCTLLDYLFEQEAEFKSSREAQTRGLSEIINGNGAGDILVLRQASEIIAMVNLIYIVSTAFGSRVAIL